jgi:hypothetical protein
MEKCSKCYKKIILVFECKCQNKYCIKCHIPENHNCEFDYKRDGKELLEKKLIQIETSKNFDKII